MFAPKKKLPLWTFDGRLLKEIIIIIIIIVAPTVIQEARICQHFPYKSIFQ